MGKTKIEPLSVKELVKLQDAARNVNFHDQCVLMVAIATGCKIGELSRIKKRDILLDGGVKAIKFPDVERGERKIPRKVLVRNEVIENLKNLGFIKKRDDESIWDWAEGSASFERCLKKIAKLANIPTSEITTRIRYGAGGFMAGIGYPIEAIATLMGYTSLNEPEELFSKSHASLPDKDGQEDERILFSRFIWFLRQYDSWDEGFKKVLIESNRRNMELEGQINALKNTLRTHEHTVVGLTNSNVGLARNFDKINKNLQTENEKLKNKLNKLKQKVEIEDNEIIEGLKDEPEGLLTEVDVNPSHITESP